MAYAEGGYDSRSFSWGTGESRCRVSADISTTSDTQCYISFSGAVRSGNDSGSYHRISGYGVTCTVSTSDGGSASASASYNYANWVANASGGVYVTRTGSDRTVTVTCSYSSYNGASNSGSVSVSLTVPHRVWYTPKPPKNCAIARSSDTAQKLTWQGNYTGTDGGYPWSGIYLDRAVDGGSWSNLSTLSWSAVNYTDSSTKLGHKYDYRLKSYGPGGTSSATSTLTVYTTPEAFTGVTCSKPTTTTVKLTPTTSPAYYDSLVCQSTTDNGATWADCAITSDFLISSPPKGQCMFRIAAVKASGGTSSTNLQGAWCVSDVIATLCAPYAPNVADMPVVVATGTKVSVSWTPNHPDGTAQSKAQVRVTKPDGTQSTTGISGSTTTSSFTASTTGNWQVEVRTYGEYEEWGEWSSPKTVRAAVAPVLNITAPTSGATITKLPIAVSWTFTDTTGMSAQTLTVSDGTRAATQISVPVGQTSVQLSNQVAFLNNTTYTFTLSVTAGSGLVASKSVTVSISWAQPDEPDVTFEAVDCNVQMLIAAQATEPAAVSFDVRRVNLDGSSTLIATGVESGHTVIDPVAPLNVATTYRISSYAASGAVRQSVASYTVESDGHEVVGFNGGTTNLLLRYDAQGSRKIAPSGETFHLALGDGADRLPVFYADGDIDCTGTHSYVITSAEEYRRIQRLAMTYAEGYFRDAWGGVYLVRLDWDLSYDAQSYNQWNVSINMTECAWEEPGYAVS